MKKQKAFTLIELLVVIAIIGLLSTIVLVSLNTARRKARNVRRKEDINQIYTAMQMYYDKNGAYPSEAACDSSKGSCAGCPCAEDSWSATSYIYAGLVTGGYISALPVDPINNSSYYYSYEPDCGQGNCPSGCCYYRLTAVLEGEGSYTLQGY